MFHRQDLGNLHPPHDLPVHPHEAESTHCHLRNAGDVKAYQSLLPIHQHSPPEPHEPEYRQPTHLLFVTAVSMIVLPFFPPRLSPPPLKCPGFKMNEYQMDHSFCFACAFSDESIGMSCELFIGIGSRLLIHGERNYLHLLHRGLFDSQNKTPF